MKDNGLRLLLVGYESGDDQQSCTTSRRVCVRISRGASAMTVRKLGVLIHGTFILGLPGETTETIEKTINFAKEVNPHTIQVSLAAPYPGTTLYKQAVENGWLRDSDAATLVNDKGVQRRSLGARHSPPPACTAWSPDTGQPERPELCAD